MKIRQFIFNILIPAIAGALIFVFIYYGRIGFIPGIAEKPLLYLLSISMGIAVGFLMIITDRFFENWWDSNFTMSVFLALQIFVKLLLALAIVFSFTLAYLTLGLNINIDKLWDIYHDEILKLIILTALITITYSLISFALQSYNYYAFHRIQRLKQERDQLELQFQTLKSQLSPHYLFNCLNTISSLIHTSASQTEDFIRRMAKTFQYVLTNDNKKLVKIAEEVEFVRSFNYLLKVRFGNQLILNINLPKNITEGYIPPLTLQMLLENAVKHNIIDEDHQVVVSIYSQDEKYLIVENTKTVRPPDFESFHIGLENIKKRYNYLSEHEIKVSDTDKFEIKLPVIYQYAEVYE